MNDEVDELATRVQWILSLLAMRIASDDSTRPAAVEALVAATVDVNTRTTPESRNELLSARFGLSETEVQVVWLLAASAVDSEAVHDALVRAGSPMLTLENIRRVVYGRRPNQLGQRELARDGTLRRFGLIERTDSNPRDTPEGRWTWGLAPRLLAWLHGDERVDPQLGAVARAPQSIPILADLAAADADVATIRKAMRGISNVVVVSGNVSLGRKTLLTTVAAEAGLSTLLVECRQLERDASALESQLHSIARECRLLQRTPLLLNVDAIGGDPADPRLEAIGRELAPLVDGPVLVTCGPQRPAMRWGRPVIAIDLQPLTSKQRATLWLNALGRGTESDGQKLANIYPLAPALIHDAALAARARAGDEEISLEDIAAGVRGVLDDRLGSLARRVAVRQSWDDLVLPGEHVEAITELIARVRQRTRVYEDWAMATKVGKGLGVSALFSGPPGTGKTMVAALIARELGLELFQVDLAKVVSKWIGESEKNLAALFDAAEAGHAILLFDEADALFGKRTELKSSNDRYANLETNYLLQRLETFTGIV